MSRWTHPAIKVHNLLVLIQIESNSWQSVFFFSCFHLFLNRRNGQQQIQSGNLIKKKYERINQLSALLFSLIKLLQNCKKPFSFVIWKEKPSSINRCCNHQRISSSFTVRALRAEEILLYLLLWLVTGQSRHQALFLHKL